MGGNNNGLKRVERYVNDWDWGTFGHGTFDDAVALFKAESEVATYKLDGNRTYRVFTRNKKNYVEVTNPAIGNAYTYTTNTPLNSYPDNNATETNATQDVQQKILRQGNTWAWGTYGHGSFDEAMAILKEEANVIRFKDPAKLKTNYRLFTHGALNYVEMNCGWTGGVFFYTTKN